MHKEAGGQVIVESGTEARQGHRDVPVLMVVVVGVTLALGALLGIWALWT